MPDEKKIDVSEILDHSDDDAALVKGARDGDFTPISGKIVKMHEQTQEIDRKIEKLEQKPDANKAELTRLRREYTQVESARQKLDHKLDVTLRRYNEDAEFASKLQREAIDVERGYHQARKWIGSADEGRLMQSRDRIFQERRQGWGRGSLIAIDEELEKRKGGKRKPRQGLEAQAPGESSLTDGVTDVKAWRDYAAKLAAYARSLDGDALAARYLESLAVTGVPRTGRVPDVPLAAEVQYSIYLIESLRRSWKWDDDK